jgi:hypothetical protein
MVNVCAVVIDAGEIERLAVGAAVGAHVFDPTVHTPLLQVALQEPLYPTAQLPPPPPDAVGGTSQLLIVVAEQAAAGTAQVCATLSHTFGDVQVTVSDAEPILVLSSRLLQVKV